MNVLEFAVDFSLKGVDKWRNLFYIVIDALQLHDLLI